MKSVSKLLATLAFVAAFGASVAAHAEVCGSTGFPKAKFIETREVCASHVLNQGYVVASLDSVAVYFKNASSTPSASEAAKLRDVAAILKSPAYRHAHVAVQGYTDSKGKDAANQRLSYHRAVRVMHILIKKYGVPAGMLSAQGFGKENPAADNRTAAGRALNRRVTFAVVD